MGFGIFRTQSYSKIKYSSYITYTIAFKVHRYSRKINSFIDAPSMIWFCANGFGWDNEYDE